MVRFEDDCVGCDWGSCGGCIYSRKLPYLYCDECGSEDEILYEYYGKQLCEDCLREVVEPEYDEDGEEIELELKEYHTISYDNAEYYYDFESEYDFCDSE